MYSLCCKSEGDNFFLVYWQVHGIYISVEMVRRWSNFAVKI